MGSMISVGETVDSCDCTNYSKFSSFTISEAALNKASKPILIDTGNPAGQALVADIITGNQSENYLKQMRCAQHEHSKQSGLTMEQIEGLLESLADHSQSLMEIGAENAKELVDSVKEEGSLIACAEPVNKYLKTIEDQANNISYRNSKKVKVDTSVFS